MTMITDTPAAPSSQRGAHVGRERGVERRHALWRGGLGMLVEDLRRLEELRQALHVQCGRIQAMEEGEGQTESVSWYRDGDPDEAK